MSSCMVLCCAALRCAVLCCAVLCCAACCCSVNKDLLLNAEGFIPLLVDSLLLDEDHPRRQPGMAVPDFDTVAPSVQRVRLRLAHAVSAVGTDWPDEWGLDAWIALNLHAGLCRGNCSARRV